MGGAVKIVPFVRRWWPLALLVALCVVSVGLRAGSFGMDPLQKNALTPYQVFNNTDVYIHNKFVLDIYDKYSPSEHMFAGYIGGGPYLAHKDLPLTVYTSFAPTHFVVLYAVLKPLGAIGNFAAWQIFGLVIQLICVGLLWRLILALTRDKLLAVLGASMYLFATGTLHFHMHVFWAHQLLQPIFIGTLLLFVKRGGVFKKGESFAAGFAMSLVAWTGVVGVIGYVLYGAYQFYRTRSRAYLNYVFMLGGMIVALALVLVQVLLATGSDLLSYLKAVKGRVAARSATGGLIPFPRVVWNYANNVFLEYGGYMVLAYTLAIRRKLKPFEWAVLFVASFPLVETVLLVEHDTIYGFGRLKWLVPFILVIVLFARHYVKSRRAKMWLIGAVTGINIVHIALYFVIYWNT